MIYVERKIWSFTVAKVRYRIPTWKKMVVEFCLPASLCWLISGSFKIPACLDAPFKQNGKYPVVIFSHGLGAFRYWHPLKPHCRRSFPLFMVDNNVFLFPRTLYSAICIELASQGFIVASVEHRWVTQHVSETQRRGQWWCPSVKPETVSPLTQVLLSCLLGWHRDESASATYYFRQKSQLEQAASKQCSPGPTSLVKEWLYYRPLQQGENEFSLRNKQVDCTTSELCTHGYPRFSWYSLCQSFIWCWHSRADRDVNGEHFCFHPQVNCRADECILALEKLTQLNSGSPLQNVLQTQFDMSALEVTNYDYSPKEQL